MPMKVCVDCGTVFPADSIGAVRCCLCAARKRAKSVAKKAYPQPPVDELVRDVRLADAAGKSYGVWRKDQMLAEQKAREALEEELAHIERLHKEKEKE